MKLAVLLFFLGGGAYALPLKPLPQIPSFQIDPSQDTPVPTCAEIRDRLKKYKDINQYFQFGLTEFMEGSANRIQEWYDELKPLEGQKNAIPKGAFDKLSQGAEDMRQLTSLSYENIDYLDRDLSAIMEALETCLSQTKK